MGSRSTYGNEFPVPILAPFGRRSFFGTERLDTPTSEAIPSSRRPRKSSPNISANPPMTNGLSSPSTSSPKRASSSITPLSFVCQVMSERRREGQLDGTHNLLVCIIQLLPKFGQPTAVPNDVVLDIPFQIPHFGDTTLKQCMQNNFLSDTISVIEPWNPTTHILDPPQQTSCLRTCPIGIVSSARRSINILKQHQ